MKKSLTLTVAVLFSSLLIATVYAGPNDPVAPQTGEGQVLKDGKNRQITTKKPGYSVAKDYKKRVANKKRAAELRKKLIQESR